MNSALVLRFVEIFAIMKLQKVYLRRFMLFHTALECHKHPKILFRILSDAQKGPRKTVSASEKFVMTVFRCLKFAKRGNSSVRKACKKSLRMLQTH